MALLCRIEGLSIKLHITYLTYSPSKTVAECTYQMITSAAISAFYCANATHESGKHLQSGPMIQNAPLTFLIGKFCRKDMGEVLDTSQL